MQNLLSGGVRINKKFGFSWIVDFWLVLSKNDSNNICSSIKNESFLKIWRVWHILKVCHALCYLKIEMGIAGSIFELHPPDFQKMCIFWRFTNDISITFRYLLWFQCWKKCQSLPVHPRVIPDKYYKRYMKKWWLLFHIVSPSTFSFKDTFTVTGSPNTFVPDYIF